MTPPQPRLDFINNAVGNRPMPDGAPSIEALQQADPSQNKRYYQRIILWARNGQLVDQDNLTLLRLSLQRLMAAQVDLPEDKRDINRIESPQALVKLVWGDMLQVVQDMLKNTAIQAEWALLAGFPNTGSLQDKTVFALNVLVANDPTGGRHAPHMIRWLRATNDRLLPEDLPRMHGYLTLYQANRSRIPSGQRNLSDCPTHAKLFTLITPFKQRDQEDADELQYIENREIRAGGAIEVACGPTWRLIHIQTQDSAIALGAGTDWCTSWTGDRQNHFPEYADNLLYLRDMATGSRYQLHFKKWHLKNADDQNIRDLPAFLRSQSGLLTALNPYAIPNIPQALTNAAEKGRALEVATLLTTCRDVPEWQAAANIVAETVIPQALTIAAENGWAPEVATLLTACRDVPEWRAAANIVAATVIPQALTNAAKYGRASGITALLTTCRDVPEWQAAAATVIPQVLTNAAENDGFSVVTSLLTACRDVPEWQAAVDTVAEMVIPQVLTIAVKNGWASEVADLLTACRDVPEWRAAVDTVAATVIAQALTITAENGWASDVTALLTTCRDVPEWRTAADTVAEMVIPQALTRAAKNGIASYVSSLLTTCRGVPEWRAAADTAAATVIPQALTNAAKNGRASYVSALLTTCLDVPEWDKYAAPFRLQQDNMKTQCPPARAPMFG